MTNTAKKALAYAIGMIQSMPSYRQDDDALHDMRTDIMNEISATDLAEIVTDVEMRSGKAVRLYHDYIEPTDPAGALFKATYDRARGLAYAGLIQWHERHPLIGKSPDPTVMAKRAAVCLDDETNKTVHIKAHNEAVDALAKLHATLEVSATLMDLHAEPEAPEEQDDDATVPFQTAELIDFDDLPISSTEH
ncbi:hypothetical protein C5L14_16640 [Labrys okinawensis]|uniref:Uncharacterized protein n=1 Tax=Labrys okinawensis TaxID=346911 RepID=A0A2S9QC32_9HYPH|nr:hypothetical protein [Labrys okinawensis]PRH86913.1 hypothetical protein C5L14_16640 [Labrys okinawensis]